ncbi:hypothetical protein KAR04_00150 [Candidatus Calescamantes bacterium]|nr:hypothetical protein [Candidatus Calescamantes bacterium]
MPESFSFNGTEYIVTDLKVESENNVFDMFSCRLNGPSASVRSTIGHGGHLLASHEVIIKDKDSTQIFGGFLEWVEQDGVDLILKGRDYKVLLLDERTPRDTQWINQTGSTIINALVGYSTKVAVGTIDYSDTLSGTLRFSHENLLRAVATACAQNEKDFWATIGAKSSPSIEYDETNQNANEWFGGNVALAQSFTPSQDMDVVKVGIYAKFISSTQSDITVSIRADDGSGKPTGGDLTSGTLPGFGDTSYAWKTIDVDRYSLTNGTKYHIVVLIPPPSYGTYSWGLDNTSPTYTGGTQSTSTDLGSSWTVDSTADQIFRVYGVELNLNVGARGSGSVGSPNSTYSAGIETEIAAETKVTMKVVNRQRVFGAGDGINQIQVCVPWIDINEPDNNRSQGFDGTNADCTHAVATTSQGDVGIMEGKPYVDTGIVSTDIAIATAKAILDVAAPVAAVKTLDVDFLKYVTGDGLGDWIRIIDRKQGVDSTLRVKKIMRNLEDKIIRMEFYTPEEDISQALARIERDSDLSNLNGLGATNLIIVNFPDICDNTTPYEMWFELPSEVIFINRIKLTYIVDDYRAFSGTTTGGSAHTHGIQVVAPTLNAAGGSAIGYVGVQSQDGTNRLVANQQLTSIQSGESEAAHTHGVDFTITKQADSLTDIAIWVDDGAGFVDKTTDIETDIGHTLGTSSEYDIPIAAYISATTDLKKIRIVPTGSNNGECRITGLCMTMFYMESK